MVEMLDGENNTEEVEGEDTMQCNDNQFLEERPKKNLIIVINKKDRVFPVSKLEFIV